MSRPSLRTRHAVALVPLFALVALSAPAAASQCAEDLVLLEPTNIEIVVTPPQACLTVEVVPSGCGDSIAVRVENQCADAALIVGGDPRCTVEAPCEAAPEGRVFLDVPETSGHVDISFTVTVGANASEVDASFDISQDADTPGDAGDGGCSASGAREAGGTGAAIVALGLVAALRRRRR